MKKTNEKCIKTNYHEGHRQRVQEKVYKYGLRSLEPHELLEYLLWYTIPRKDTNNIGHALIEKFGTIANVIDADPKYLQKIKGVGKRSSMFLTCLPELFSIYKESSSEGKLDVLNTIADCIRFFRSKFEIRKVETFYVICLNSGNQVVKYEQLEGESGVQVNIDTKKFSDFINDSNVVSVLVFHTHPYGQVSPSFEDITTTETIMSVCNTMYKYLTDHIIFNETSHFSFGRNNLMEKIAHTTKVKAQPQMKETLKSRKVTPFSYIDNGEEPGVLIELPYVINQTDVNYDFEHFLKDYKKTKKQTIR